MTVVMVAILVCLAASFFNAVEFMGSHEAHMTIKVEDHPEITIQNIGTEPLDHENMFKDTLKSCLPQDEEGETKKRGNNSDPSRMFPHSAAIRAMKTRGKLAATEASGFFFYTAYQS